MKISRRTKGGSTNTMRSISTRVLRGTPAVERMRYVLRKRSPLWIAVSFEQTALAVPDHDHALEAGSGPFRLKRATAFWSDSRSRIAE